MAAITTDPQRSTYPISRRSILMRAEIDLRSAGRALELSTNREQQRLAAIVFRLASRVRADRLAERAAW